jgi:hypothetical protein
MENSIYDATESKAKIERTELKLCIYFAFHDFDGQYSY